MYKREQGGVVEEAIQIVEKNACNKKNAYRERCIRGGTGGVVEKRYDVG